MSFAHSSGSRTPLQTYKTSVDVVDAVEVGGKVGGSSGHVPQSAGHCTRASPPALGSEHRDVSVPQRAASGTP